MLGTAAPHKMGLHSHPHQALAKACVMLLIGMALLVTTASTVARSRSPVNMLQTWMQAEGRGGESVGQGSQLGSGDQYRYDE